MSDVYISMRHTPASTYCAAWIQKGLGASGVRVCDGYSQRREGTFPQDLAKTVQRCGNMIVLLTPETFGNADDNENWMAYEIEAALDAHVNVIPVVTADFVWPARLPARMEGLQHMAAIVWREPRDSETERLLFGSILQRLGVEREPDVFISYSQTDKAVVQELQRALDRVGIVCRTAADSVIEEIRRCRLFLCVVSQSSQKSSWVAKELDVAVNCKKTVLSFHIDDTPLDDVFRYYLGVCPQIEAHGRIKAATQELIKCIFELKQSAPPTVSVNTAETTVAPAPIAPYSGNKKYIFASYCHKNAERFLEIAQALINEGYRVWYDEGIDPGTEWDEYIAEKIENSGFFVAFVTEEYLASDNCKDELKYARDLQKGRLLVYLSDVQLTGGLAMRMNRLQAIHQYRYPTMDAFIEKVKQTPSLEEYRD